MHLVNGYKFYAKYWRVLKHEYCGTNDIKVATAEHAFSHAACLFLVLPTYLLSNQLGPRYRKRKTQESLGERSVRFQLAVLLS